MIAIDVGNTSIKLGEFRGSPSSSVPDPVRRLRLSTYTVDWPQLDAWFPTEPTSVFIATVCQPATDELSAWLSRHRPGSCLRQLRLANFPIRVDVEYPERVGHDRLAAAVAAKSIKTADRAAIIVDAGSAITVDLISPVGDFLGGAILPGWQTMARSLAADTHQLPLVQPIDVDRPPDVIGRSTEEAIASGLYWGSVGAVKEIVDRMSGSWSPAPDRILGGGDMQVLVKHLGRHVRSLPDLVLRGIAQTVAANSWPEL